MHEEDARLAFVDRAELAWIAYARVDARRASVLWPSVSAMPALTASALASNGSIGASLDGSRRGASRLFVRRSLRLDDGEIKEGATGATKIALRLECGERRAFEPQAFGDCAATRAREAEILLGGRDDER